MRLFPSVALVLAFAPPALAQTAAPRTERPAIAVLFGVVHVQEIVFDEVSGEPAGLSGPILAANAHFPIATRVALNLTVSGFKAEDSFIEAGSAGTIRTRDVSIEPLVRFYTSEPGKTRGFFEVGPSINFLKAAVFLSSLGVTVVDEDETTTKLGAVLGGGVQIPLTPKVSAEVVGQYALVPEWVTLNYSQLRVMGGITIRLGR